MNRLVQAYEKLFFQLLQSKLQIAVENLRFNKFLHETVLTDLFIVSFLPFENKSCRDFASDDDDLPTELSSHELPQLIISRSPLYAAP